MKLVGIRDYLAAASKLAIERLRADIALRVRALTQAKNFWTKLRSDRPSPPNLNLQPALPAPALDALNKYKAALGAFVQDDIDDLNLSGIGASEDVERFCTWNLTVIGATLAISLTAAKTIVEFVAIHWFVMGLVALMISACLGVWSKAQGMTLRRTCRFDAKTGKFVMRRTAAKRLKVQRKYVEEPYKNLKPHLADPVVAARAVEIRQWANELHSWEWRAGRVMATRMRPWTLVYFDSKAISGVYQRQRALAELSVTGVFLFVGCVVMGVVEKALP